MKTIIVFLIIFSIIVVIHEFGHFYLAKRAGIRVREFAIGMGPKLFAGHDREGTTYTLRMLPLGGYVRLAGLYEDENIEPGMEIGIQLDDNQIVQKINLSNKMAEDELPIRVDEVDLIYQMYIKGIPATSHDLETYSVSKEARIIEEDGTEILVAPIETRYESASVWDKFKTNIAGPLNNFILSIVAFSLFAFLIGGVPSTSNQIGMVQENSPAAQAGLQAGDYITEINGQAIESWDDITETVRQLPGETVTIQYVRGDQQIEKQITVDSVDGMENQEAVGQIGVGVGREDSFLDKLLYGFTETWAVITGVLSVIGGMIVNGFNINNFGGPVAMAQMTGQVVDSGLSVIIWFLGMLSANIGIFNLLPIPALDGGKILLNAIEGIRGKPLSQSTEGIITIIGVIIMLALVVAVTWNDIQRAFF